MSDKTSNWKKLADSVISIFSNNGTIDMDELNYLMSVALEDNVIDEKERNVLKGIFAQISKEMVSAEVWAKIQEIRKQHSI
ncbi:MAG: hypothetical protein OEV44_04270 [Spirochaetota bacterium]|nr:hypothetical protein [Spirochaetota bacterium]